MHPQPQSLPSIETETSIRAPKKQKLSLEEIGGFTQTTAQLSSEFDTWTAAKNIDKNMDILQWWKAHESDFPTLAILAKRYLAIPASSAPSERVFSTLKNIVSAKRVNMSGKTLCQLLFIRHHQRELNAAR